LTVNPSSLNLGSNGKWVSVTITLPSGYSGSQVDISSVRLEGTLSPDPSPQSTGSNYIQLKFKRGALIARLIEQGKTSGSVVLTVTGIVAGRSFEGSTTISVS
jgi:hypothetical protein